MYERGNAEALCQWPVNEAMRLRLFWQKNHGRLPGETLDIWSFLLCMVRPQTNKSDPMKQADHLATGSSAF